MPQSQQRKPFYIQAARLSSFVKSWAQLMQQYVTNLSLSPSRSDSMQTTLKSMHASSGLIIIDVGARSVDIIHHINSVVQEDKDDSKIAINVIQIWINNGVIAFNRIWQTFSPSNKFSLK
jgi:hypothetical protein